MSTMTCSACGRDNDRGGLVCPHCATPYKRQPFTQTPAGKGLATAGAASFRVVRGTLLVFAGTIAVVLVAGRMSCNSAAPAAAPRATPAFEAELQRGVQMAKTFEAAVADGKVLVGMTADQARRAWGVPSAVNSTTTARGVSEQWVYERAQGAGDYLYLQNGTITSIQQTRR